MTWGQWHALLFPDPLANFVKPIRHYEAHSGEVVGGAETAGGDVALGGGLASVVELNGVCWEVIRIYLVLDGLVATGWRQVLRHRDMRMEERTWWSRLRSRCGIGLDLICSSAKSTHASLTLDS
jgi:hypothetical protein